MTVVMLSWDDPEDARQFLALRAVLRRQGWLPDMSRDTLVELVRLSEAAGDGSEEESSG